MRNRDMPATAYPTSIYRDMDRPVEFVGGAEGLTKREEAAIAAMQSLRLAHPHLEPSDIARFSIYDADALFDELEKEKAND